MSAQDGVEFSNLNSVNTNSVSVSQNGQVNNDGDITFSLQPSSSNVDETITIDGAVVEAPTSTGNYNLTVNVTDTGGNNAENSFEDAFVVGTGSGDQGFLSGRISDQNNNDVPNANITAVRTSDGLTFTTDSNSNGEYTVAVEPGDYNVTVERQGFTTAQAANQAVTSNRTTTANLVITRNINADDIFINESDSAAIADDTDEVSYTVLVTTNDTENGSFVPLDGVDIDASSPSSNVNFTSTTETTNDSGLATFTATSGQVGEFNITFTDQAGNTVNTTATFREARGNANIQGEVTDNESNIVEGATVYAAYPGENQTLAYAQEQAPFLVSPVNSEGKYSIEGITASEGPVNLYVKANGFNRLNETSSTGSYVAANESQDVVANATENHDFTVFPGGPAQEFRLNVTVNDEKSIEVADGSTVIAEVTVESRPEASTEAFQPAPNQEVDVSLTNNLPLEPNNATVTTGPDGTETVEFQATESGTTNVTAETNNSEDDVYNTTGSQQAEVTVFTSAELTGDVVNEDEEELARGQATVELFEYNGTSQEFESTGRTSEIGTTGSYVFTNLRSGNVYQVVAETVTGLRGTATTGPATGPGIPEGTTTNDIVVVGAEPGPADFQVSDLNPQDVTVAQGDTITVTANITNGGLVEGNKTVEFRVGGTTLRSQPVSLNASETTQVRFENISTTDLSPGNYTHGVYTADDSQTATLTVESGQSPPIVDEYRNANGVVDQDGVLDALVDFNSGEITNDQVLDVLVAFNS
ncbi:carboxypeptidase regulatory-like domain-containing protein [Halomicroarcula sp. GCM10025709]|uniref:carboxypeptidase regulatory-like domain-containing protein n=1 Tax=Halomicroarcula sp. GCM10025709 TaxID=3252669 RepID=UPI0036151654